MSIEPILNQNPLTYSHLFFIYEPSRREILFASSPIENFFESTIDWQKSFPFQSLNPSQSSTPGQTQDLGKKWQECLKLSENETAQFSFLVSGTGKDHVLYQFDAINISTSINNAESSVLFAAKKYVLNTYRPDDGKNRENYRKDYAEFIDIAAHDLDAPLRKVSLLLERLIQKNSSEDLQNYYQRMQNNILEMRTLIDKLSAWSAFGTATLQCMPCDTAVLLSKVLKELQQKNPDKNISFDSADLPVLWGDKQQLQELFKQLLKNAVVFSRKGENIQITVSSETLPAVEKTQYNLDPRHEYARISIGDNGIGFDPEYGERIFKPFVRLHGKSEYPGAGMGLAIGKKIVDNHGGIIYGKPNQDYGATFTLILPQSR